LLLLSLLLLLLPPLFGKITMPIGHAFWGDRCGGIEDPFGHKWMIATHKKDMTLEEMQKAGQEFMESMKQQAKV
jgi:PhnB protein